MIEPCVNWGTSNVRSIVLHRRNYRETSLIVELFTKDHGRIAAVARGTRKAGSHTAGLLQPFMPLIVSWYGKGELVTLTHVESNGFLGMLSGKNLRCGFYLNELLMRFLAKQDAHAQLFAIYRQALVELQRAADTVDEKILRLFEKQLLVEIGYGLPTEAVFNADVSYAFDANRGFIPAHAGQQCFSGKMLNALLSEDFADSSLLQEIKQLMRFVFSSLLGGRPLQSRKLFE
jgi:DNA repair protein RecO (recombination protein O)